MADELEEIRARLRRELLAEAARRAAKPVDLASDEFDGFVARHPVVLVDFWAAWCGPCRQTEPVVAEVARRWAGRATVAKVNVDDQPVLADRFRVASIPTFLFFAHGRLAGRLVGVQPPRAFDEILEDLSAQPKT